MEIFITGVTGFLGGEILVELAKRTDIKKIFCLVRAQNEENARVRLKKVFNLHNDYFDPGKIIPVTGELTDDNLAVKLISNHHLTNVEIIIHSAANTSFSKIYDSLVEKINIGGTTQILEWAKTLKNLKFFTYVGTASICGTKLRDCIIEEDMSPNLSSKHLVKYSYTKMLGEFLVRKYLPDEKVLIVRPSIIMGDSRPWVPRSNVILWALATFNELRLFPSNAQSNIDIISIDYAARAINELIFNTKRKYNVYHISSGTGSVTNPGKVTDAIKDYYPDKPDFKFVSKGLLSDMKKWSKNVALINGHSVLHQYSGYLDYWIDNFGDNSKLRILFYALEPYINFIDLGQTFDNTRLLEDTSIGPPIPAHEYLRKSAKHIGSINIFEGAVDP